MGKLIAIAVVGLLILAILIATPIVIALRKQAEAMYEKYDSFTNGLLAQRFSLKPYEVKPEFRTLNSWRFLKLFKIVNKSRHGERVGRVNVQDATMFLFMKMYTLVIRPDLQYNLPMLSVDIIFMGAKRLFIIEIIDPAHIDDPNKMRCYEQLKKWTPKVDPFEPSPTRDWYKDFVTDFSIHIKAHEADDDLLFEIYSSYLHAYLDMVRNAQTLSPELSAQVKAGMESYVSTLLAEGGPAVEFLEKMVGPEAQREYIRTVMFGLE